jgi:hypothetical protein
MEPSVAQFILPIKIDSSAERQTSLAGWSCWRRWPEGGGRGRKWPAF